VVLLKRESRSVEVVFQVVGFKAVKDIGFTPGAEREAGIVGDRICLRVMEDGVVGYGIVLTLTDELEGIPTFNAVFEQTGLERFSETKDSAFGVSHELDEGIKIDKDPSSNAGC
jgi:hypothetical protein